MITKTDKEKLSLLIEAFYNLTGIKAAVYDQRLCKICSFPESDSPFCTMIQNNEKSCNLCEESTAELCKNCLQSSSPLILKCHAGLTEVVAPLRLRLPTNKDSVIGYIMFGQITTEPEMGIFIEEITKRCEKYGMDMDLLIAAAKNIPYCSDKKIEDVTKILGALAGYIVFENIVYPTEISTPQKIFDYVESNLDKNLSCDKLCKKFFISKTELYKILSPYAPEGIAAFIREKRLNAAKELLKKTDKPACIIAAEVGFSDVNYFLRVFKKKVGESAASYRKRIL